LRLNPSKSKEILLQIENIKQNRIKENLEKEQREYQEWLKSNRGV